MSAPATYIDNSIAGSPLKSRITRELRFRSIKQVKKRKALDRIKSEFRKKFQKRTGLLPGMPAAVPKTNVHAHFDPLYCLKHCEQIAHGIWRSTLTSSFVTAPALLHRIPKPGSVTKREIMEFSIPDAAFANVLNKALLSRNLKRFSGNSFAYRPDRNQFDAILNLKQYLKSDKVFVVQFDFEKYFDTIPHSYLTMLLDNYEVISISKAEKDVVRSFLCHQYATKINYSKKKFNHKAKIGTPQGSSVSLFLANLANDALDKRIEGVNGQFVRYADDVVAVANNYEDAIRIEQCFHDHCKEAGLKINFKKSDGIRLLSFKGEIASIQSFKFLGYDFGHFGCSISSKSIARIKSKLSRLIHIYLVHYIDKFGFNHSRTVSASSLPFFDWDLMGLVAELRGYMYGGASEDSIYKLLNRGSRIPPMRGLLSFYALVDSRKELEHLDGWLVNNLRCALNKRRIILKQKYNVDYPRFSNKQLILGNWYDPAYNKTTFLPDPRLPSFVRGWRAAKKYYQTFGLSDASPPPYTGY